MATGSPGISQLQALLGEDDSERPMEISDASLSKINESTGLRQSGIGDALENMMSTYAEMISLANIQSPTLPNAAEHVKEITELHIKHWRDSCLDMTTELTRIAMQWELSNLHEKNNEELEDILRSVERQKQLFDQTKSVLDKRTDQFFSNPLS